LSPLWSYTMWVCILLLGKLGWRGTDFLAYFLPNKWVNNISVCRNTIYFWYQGIHSQV
jgi:hypothetical protein